MNPHLLTTTNWIFDIDIKNICTRTMMVRGEKITKGNNVGLNIEILNFYNLANETYLNITFAPLISI